MVDNASDEVVCIDEIGEIRLANPAPTKVFVMTRGPDCETLYMLMPEYLRKRRGGFSRYSAGQASSISIGRHRGSTGSGNMDRKFPVELHSAKCPPPVIGLLRGLSRDIREESKPRNPKPL